MSSRIFVTAVSFVCLGWSASFAYAFHTMSNNYERKLGAICSLKTVYRREDHRLLLSRYIEREFNVPTEVSYEVVESVYLYSDPTAFPRPETVLAVIATESSFRPAVISKVGAKGMMQVKEVFHGSTPTIRDNVRTGIRVLRAYRKRVKSNDDALHAYNVGITDFKRGIRNVRYVNRVKAYRKEFETILRASEV